MLGDGRVNGVSLQGLALKLTTALKILLLTPQYLESTTAETYSSRVDAQVELLHVLLRAISTRDNKRNMTEVNLLAVDVQVGSPRRDPDRPFLVRSAPVAIAIPGELNWS